jgi:hypothetical protein
VYSDYNYSGKSQTFGSTKGDVPGCQEVSIKPKSFKFESSSSGRCIQIKDGYLGCDYGTQRGYSCTSWNVKKTSKNAQKALSWVVRN